MRLNRISRLRFLIGSGQVAGLVWPVTGSALGGGLFNVRVRHDLQ